ncbi:hypothetical protein OG481_09810 [Streptomyces longwoodensis]|uniref:hypothetical protein n=1 Tax=Streptomyces longwoodensis TaxID=68231 RepID=UPI002DD944D8|nr:hypothetical protein [Streptomyces longwoodensis]WRY88812.1 hypothetical protein OG481_09810 [Streptomyces longwoodensis]
MAALNTTVVGLTGSTVTYTPASGGGDTCETGAGVVLLVKNGDASSHTVTLVTPEVVDGDLAVADRAVTVAAGAERAIPVTGRYRNPSTGRAAITYDAVTSVTVAVLRVPAL